MCLTTMIFPMSWGLSVCKVKFILGLLESIREGCGPHMVHCSRKCWVKMVHGSQIKAIPGSVVMMRTAAATFGKVLRAERCARSVDSLPTGLAVHQVNSMNGDDKMEYAPDRPSPSLQEPRDNGPYQHLF